MSMSMHRVLLFGFGLYMIWKTSTAPKRGRFFTIFGNIRQDSSPRAFKACLVGGYVLAAVMLLAVLAPDTWLAALNDQ